MIGLSLVVPCYNGENNVREFYSVAKKVFEPKKYDYEIVFVNDGSKDRTLSELHKVYEED